VALSTSDRGLSQIGQSQLHLCFHQQRAAHAALFLAGALAQLILCFLPTPIALLQGIVNLIKVLQKRGVAVYLVSGSFRELIMPIAKYLGVPKENVFANRMDWCVPGQWRCLQIDWASGRCSGLRNYLNLPLQALILSVWFHASPSGTHWIQT